MKVDRNSMEYRKSAHAFVIRGNEILVTQEVQWNNNEWGFPGGQIEKGETPEQTALRELMEEFPKNTFTILKHAKEPLKYEWPDEMIEEDLKEKGWSCRGQIREQFLAQLNEPDIVEAKANEIKTYKWVCIDTLSNYLIYPNQLENTLRALEELGVLVK